jgi:hypothetical protein
MQKDLVVIDARALNLWPAHDPITAALQATPITPRSTPQRRPSRGRASADQADPVSATA